MLLALARAHQSAGNGDKAAEGYRRLFYEFPLSDLAADGRDGARWPERPAAGPRIARALQARTGPRRAPLRRAPLPGRARRVPDCCGPLASGDDAELVALRIAESDNYLHRYRQACDALAAVPRLGARERPRRRSSTSRRCASWASTTSSCERSRALVADFPDSSWAEETLNNLATHFILSTMTTRRDERVSGAVRRSSRSGRHAERAAWKSGWWAYKHDALPGQRSASSRAPAATFPRSDYRPAYLYWSARAPARRSGDDAGATTLYGSCRVDYLQLLLRAPRGEAARHREGRADKTEPAVRRRRAAPSRLIEQASARPGRIVACGKRPPRRQGPDERFARRRRSNSFACWSRSNSTTPARDELLYAQRSGVRHAGQLNATLAWVYNKLGDYRRGIIVMKRAYPQFMSADAARLPADLLKVIFPIDYWSLIRRYAPANGTSIPYLVAALINQESSFLADAKSSANAIGLMQILPSTGRRYARTLRVRRGLHRGLAHEAGDQPPAGHRVLRGPRDGASAACTTRWPATTPASSRVTTWTAERPGLERDEFIDDIPFPETQNYVKRILGTAEDYRRLYGDQPTLAAKPVASKATGAGKAPPKPSAATKKPAKPPVKSTPPPKK